MRQSCGKVVPNPRSVDLMKNVTEMAIGVLLDQVGIHPAAWRHPSTPFKSELEFEFFRDLAKTAERGKLDFVFFADGSAVRRGNLDILKRTNIHITHLEPITLISGLAAATDNIGIAATVSTSFTEPYNVARQFSSLDHISRGRVGWNVVTTSDPDAARNFGREQDDRARRYDRANEFVDVVKGLWDSWEDDAFVRDRENGIYFDPEKMHTLNHAGEFFKVRGPLNISRCPQGRPVIISAGGSEQGRDHAARTSEVVFSIDNTLEKAKLFYRDQKSRLCQYGRSEDDLKILTALSVYVGRTDEEARQKLDSLSACIHPDVGRAYLSVDLGFDITHLPIDEPIPVSMLPEATNRAQSYFDVLATIIREERPTVKQLYERAASSRGDLNPVIGSPKTIADRMEEWFTEGAVDGFMLQLGYLPDALNDFVDLVVPELQRRGLFRHDYAATTLREHLGLRRPANQFSLKLRARTNAYA